MPKKYLALKKKFLKQGLRPKAAKTKAARIYIGTSEDRSAAAKRLKED